MLWNSSLSWYQVNQWYGVRVHLPVSAATPQFALKWVNTNQGMDKGETPLPAREECTSVHIDNIVFPAKPPTAENLGLGLGTSQGCETCKDVCLPLLQTPGEAEDRVAAGSILGRPGLSS